MGRKLPLKILSLVILFPMLFFSCGKKKSLEDVSLESDPRQNVNGLFPEHVSIRTMTQSYCLYGEFILSGGRIYYKAPGDEEWSLFLKTGLPHSSKINPFKRFSAPEKIVEICADGDSLYAFDDEGFLYVCYLNQTELLTPFEWKKQFGFPSDDTLHQTPEAAKKRAWSMGARRSEVLWYEDIYGNQHHFGTMGLETVYFLSEDGKRIRFTDSGLPQDFSRSIETPLHGTFISENISASASTLFVIGSQGRMFTRLIDFDTMGCDPMFFQYTYDKLPQTMTGSDYLSNYSPWALPAEDWMEQPKIPLSGEARLTRFISIAQNGLGNEARVLRVAGLDSEGNTGFYYKQLKDKSWLFAPVNLFFSDDDFLDYKKSETTGMQEIVLKGYITKNGSVMPEIECEINGLGLHSTDDCTVTLRKGNDSYTCRLYLVEKWTYIKRGDPGYDGSTRNYFITAEGGFEGLQDADEDFAFLIKDLFAQKNHALFAIAGEATKDYVQLEITGSDWNEFLKPLTPINSYMMFFSSNPQTSIQPAVSKYFYTLSLPILKQSVSDSLMLENEKIYAEDDKEYVERIIEENRLYLKKLKDERKNYKEIKDSAEMSRWGYTTLELITRVTFLNHLNFPKIKQMTSVGGDLLETNVQSLSSIVDYLDWSYKSVEGLVKHRIKRYSHLLDSIEDGEPSSLNGTVQPSYPDYYNLVNLPFHAVEKDADGQILKRLEMIDFIPYFPGYYIQNADGRMILVMLKDSPSVIDEYLSEYTTEDLAENPLSIKAQFMSISFPSEKSLFEDLNDIRYEYSDGILEWNGTDATVWMKTAVFEKEMIFHGTEEEKK